MISTENPGAGCVCRLAWLADVHRTREQERRSQCTERGLHGDPASWVASSTTNWIALIPPSGKGAASREPISTGITAVPHRVAVMNLFKIGSFGLQFITETVDGAGDF